MMLWLRLIVCFVLVISVYDCSLGVGKTTIDPNINKSNAKASVNIDARLAQKVTYEASHKPVEQIVEDLAALTEVGLYAGVNKNDWLVRSRKMNIFVKDVKMAELMNSIAHVMKFKWSRNDDVNPPTYRLVVDGKAAAAAEAQMARAENEKEGNWRKVRQEWIDLIMKYGTKSLWEMESLREADPMLYEHTRFGITQGLYALFTEVPETKDRYASGRSFRVSSDKLSPETKSFLYDSANNLKRYLQISRKEELIGLRDMLKPEYTFDVAYGRMDVENFTPSLRWGYASIGTSGYFRLEKDAQDYEIGGLPRRDSEWEHYRSAGHYKMLDGVEPDQAWAATGDPYAKLQDDLKKEEEFLYPSEPLIEHQDFNELGKKYLLVIETPPNDPSVTAYIAIIQKAFADATGFGVVSDSWANIIGDRRMSGPEAKLSELLDKFSEKYNYNWDKSSNILEFRHRMWWKNRLNQIPDEWEEKWRENTVKNGYLSLDDLAQISNLTYEQAEESLKSDKVLGTDGIYGHILQILDTNGNLLWLRQYSALKPELRKQLKEKWISGAMLPFDQWKMAEAMLDRIGLLRSDVLFSLRDVSKDNELKYEFRVFEVTNQEGDSAANEDRFWKVTLPKYTQPKK